MLIHRLYLTLVLLSAACYSMAAPVTREQARRQAENFARLSCRQLSQSASGMHKASAYTPQGNTPYYVFDMDGEDGFVIVAGDDRAEPILGYVDGAAFDSAMIPENMRAWLDSRFETHTYEVKTEETYSWFRLYVLLRRDSNATIFQIPEWQLRGTVPGLQGMV